MGSCYQTSCHARGPTAQLACGSAMTSTAGRDAWLPRSTCRPDIPAQHLRAACSALPTYSVSALPTNILRSPRGQVLQCPLDRANCMRGGGWGGGPVALRPFSIPDQCRIKSPQGCARASMLQEPSAGHVWTTSHPCGRRHHVSTARGDMAFPRPMGGRHQVLAGGPCMSWIPGASHGHHIMALTNLGVSCILSDTTAGGLLAGMP